MSNSYSLTNNYQIQKNIQPIIIEDANNFFSPIHNTPMTNLPPMAQNISPKLYPQYNIKYQKKKKTLILDLDETLVHSSMKPFPRCADITLPLNFNGRNIFIYVLKRPYLEKFLEEMNLIYDIIVFTASLPEYAEPLLEMIDKNKVIKHILNRSHCRHFKNIYIKDLKVINRDLKDMIIIDNNPESYLMNKENAIPILTWEDDIHDNELIKLIPILKYLSNVNDVRNIINQIVDRNNETINYNAFNKIINTNNIINNNINNNILLNNPNIINNKDIINNNNQNLNNNRIPKNNDLKENINNINNINKKVYVRKEIPANGNINKKTSLPNNTNNLNNQFILNSKNNNKQLNYPNDKNNNKQINYPNDKNNNKQINYPNNQNNQKNLYPRDSQRKIETKTLKLNIPNNGIINQNMNNIDKNQNKNYTKQRINTNPINQINVSNSTINIFNGQPRIKILVNGPSQNPDINKIRRIKEENLTPIRTHKSKNIMLSRDKKINIITPITPIKENYNNLIFVNPNLEKTYDNKVTKTVSVRKLFDQSNHSFDNIKDLQKPINAKVKTLDIANITNGFQYNQNMIIKNNNVKNNNNYRNLKNEKSMNDLNRGIKIKKIDVIKTKRYIKSPDKGRNIKMKVKEKENKINIEDINNNKVKQTKKIIMERESFNREKFLRENFGIVDS